MDKRASPARQWRFCLSFPKLDPTGSEVVNGVSDPVRAELLRRMGLGDLLAPEGGDARTAKPPRVCGSILNNLRNNLQRRTALGCSLMTDKRAQSIDSLHIGGRRSARTGEVVPEVVRSRAQTSD